MCPLSDLPTFPTAFNVVAEFKADILFSAARRVLPRAYKQTDARVHGQMN